ncbi:MAG: hexitol phosphatase HxpB [Bacteroidota bacterium]
MTQAAIFDMDGLLVDSEPLWREAEIAVFAEVGLTLTEDDCRQTMGWRTDEVVQYWFDRQPWEGPDVHALSERLIDRVQELIREKAVAMPGVSRALDLCVAQQLPLALASSSPLRLIHTVLEKLQIAERFQVVCSAQHEAYGKPHPAIFLKAAQQLGVSSINCLVFEDSFYGLIAAKAARMTCIAVPDAEHHNDPRFGAADHVIHSLEALSAAHIGAPLPG